MTHPLRSFKLADETLAELGVLCGFDDDLASQITGTSNRIRGLTRYPTPQELKTASRGHVKAR